MPLQAKVELLNAGDSAVLPDMAGRCLSVQATGDGKAGIELYGTNLPPGGAGEPGGVGARWMLLGKTDSAGDVLALSPWGAHAVKSTAGAASVWVCDSPAEAHPSNRVFTPDAAAPVSVTVDTTPTAAAAVTPGAQMIVCNQHASHLLGIRFLTSSSTSGVTLATSCTIGASSSQAFSVPAGATHYTLIASNASTPAAVVTGRGF